MLHVVFFWLELGVDGFRLDAVPYLYERDRTNCENLPETHAFLKHLRAAVDARYPGRLLLAEANQWPGGCRGLFGQGDECHMAYHFPIIAATLYGAEARRPSPHRRDFRTHAEHPRQWRSGACFYAITMN